MSFLLDTDICSAQLRGNRKVQSKIMLHGGQLALSTITLGELYVWAFGRELRLGGCWGSMRCSG
jgi:tRNA(fMet)-specific endonuclease VapC